MLKNLWNSIKRKWESMKTTIGTLQNARDKRNIKLMSELIRMLEIQVNETIDK